MLLSALLLLTLFNHFNLWFSFPIAEQQSSMVPTTYCHNRPSARAATWRRGEEELGAKIVA